MVQKIRILSLEKTDEYIQKEFDAVKTLRFRLLRETDWTQLPDAELCPVDLLYFRMWRHHVRNVNISLLTFDVDNKILLKLESDKPVPTYPHNPKFIVSQFAFSDLDQYKLSCMSIYQECFPDKSISIKKLNSSLRQTKTIDSAFRKLIEHIHNGY